ncbi:MAG: TauD/TfdA family dioxygenase [Phycisphaerales bacterium]|nr:TauD/TfdA family dioxygenase [Phycisphaerales bacterium]
MSGTSIEIRRVAGALGAEITGIDLSQNLSNEVFSDVHQAFLDHQVIFFRDQKVTPEQQKVFGRRFGSLNVHPYVKGMDDHPEVMEIIKEPEDKINFGGGWHSDMSFQEKPALGSVLYGLEVPEFGGDTLFASQYAAYDALSDAMKDLLDGLYAVHTAEREYSAQGNSAQKRESMAIEQAGNDVPAYEHPVVRTHPETGRKALYVNGAFTMRFKGMSKRESRPLLEFLIDHCAQEQFTCRFRWQNGSIAFWDNRCVQHFALNDYHGQRRHMRRVTINGDKPH